MKRKNATRSTLFTSIISMLLCISMLVGTTFAWFTDSVTSGSNVITSGNLDLEVQYTLDGENWNDLNGATDLFRKGLWEPGHTEVVALKVANVGSLALKYVANMKIFEETVGKTKDGNDIVLSDILTVSTLTQQTGDVGDIALMLAYMGENMVAYEKTATFKSTNVLGEEKQLLPGDSHYVFIKVDMAETVGNEANHDGTNIPEIDFGLNVLATQYTYENDSFGNEYDKNATYDDLADTSILATETKTLEEGAASVGFNLVHNGMTIAKVTVPASAIADATQPVTVTFDGIDPSEAAIVDENTKAYAFDISVTNLKEELADDQLVTVVVTAPNALAAMKAYHNGVLIEDAVYDEVAGTITFKTASFSPFDFTYNEVEVSTFAALRAAVENPAYAGKEGVIIKLTGNIDVNLENIYSDKHIAITSAGKTVYNGVNIASQNIAVDLNGYSITVDCGQEWTSLAEVGALFFVEKDGSLNIIDRIGGGFIKMKSSVYMVWAPYEDPSYVDIYSGAFIGDSYAGDAMATPDSETYVENNNSALVYAGTGGNMNIYGGYFLYNNTPNDELDRNNGAFNAMDLSEKQCITIHEGVMLSNKEYRQNPENTSKGQQYGKDENGEWVYFFDNKAIKLEKDCEVAKVENKYVTIDGKNYSTWYQVIRGITSITATAAKNTYNIGHSFTTDDFYVYAISENGTAGHIDNFTISNVDTSTVGVKTVEITYTNASNKTATATCTVNIGNLNIVDDEVEQYWFFDGNFNVSGWSNQVNPPVNGIEVGYNNFVGQTYTAPNGETVTGFNNSWADPATKPNNGATGTGQTAIMAEGRYDLTINNALPYTTLGINMIAGYSDELLGYGYYIDDDVSTLVYNAPAIVYDQTNCGGPNADGFTLLDYLGPNNGHSLTQFTCYDLEPGKSYTVHWVAVLESGIKHISEWTVNMKPAVESDKVFVDTEKPNANVIIMSGQSNMFGASPITQDVRNLYADADFSNVYIRYNNINFNADNNLQTYYSNDSFEKYKLGIGGQSDTHFGPELALANALATSDGLKDQQWFIIKYAAAGTVLNSQWAGSCVVNGNTTNLTDDMLAYIQSAIDELSEDYDVQVRSFMWMQGESDAIDKGWANNYAAAEENLVSRVRTAFAGYATRPVGSIAGSGISFVNAGIAVNDTDNNTANGGPNDWVHAEIVNAAKVSNSQWVCSIAANNENFTPEGGPLAGITFSMGGQYVPTVANPNQSGVIVNSIFMDTHFMLAKSAATSEHEQYLSEGDKTDWAHYSAGSMVDLGGLFASGMHYLITQNG